MKTLKSPIRFSAVLLALASSACAQSKTPGSDAPAPGRASTQQSNVDPNAGSDVPQSPGQFRPGASGGGSGGSRGGPGAAPLGKFDSVIQQATAQLGGSRQTVMARSSSPDTPAIIATRPTERAVQSEWTEDLKVMDRLLLQAVRGPSANGANPMAAMGIKIMLIGREAPMYVEGAGVILQDAVYWPLAAGAPTTAKPDGKPRDPASAWERTKRELARGGPGGVDRSSFDPNLPGMPEPTPVVFKQEQLDALIASLIRTLPEAANIRHLPADEFVIISIAGADDAGAPIRLTLKVRKSDIDAAATGKLATPEEFKAKVSMRIG